MKVKVKDQVLEFMQRVNTCEMNSNEFVFEMYDRYFWKIFNFKKWPSVESITRARRYVTKAYGIWTRTKADSQQDYIDAYALKNKIHVI